MAFITRMALPRRTFLRGLGAVVGLPLLDAMVPALSAFAGTAATSARRLGFIYVPNGVILQQWTPKGEGGKSYDLSSTLSPLAGYKDRMLVVSHLANRKAESMGDGSGDHSRGCAAWLTGTHAKRTEGADVEAGVSADQIAASALGSETPLSSLELATEQNDKMVGNCESGYSCVYQNTFSWRSATTPLPMEVHPRAVFERLFGDGGTPAARIAQVQRTRSVLDSVADEVHALGQRLGSADRVLVTDYLEAIREVELRMQRIEQRNAISPAALPDAPVDIPESFEDHAKLMFDLQVLAYQADVTRIISFQLGRELSPRTFPSIGVPEPHHSISHHRNDPETMDKVAKIDSFHIGLLRYYLERLDSTPDGDGSLLDHVMLLYGGGLGDGNTHAHFDLPALVVGNGAGRLRTGQHVKCPDDTPMADLLVALLDKFGVPIERLGDSTRGIGYLSDI